jgi:hypothetical protein
MISVGAKRGGKHGGEGVGVRGKTGEPHAGPWRGDAWHDFGWSEAGGKQGRVVVGIRGQTGEPHAGRWRGDA